MLKHIVMWKLKKSNDGYTKEENATRMKVALEDLVGKISEIKVLEVGININKSDSVYDIVLYSEFEDEKDLIIYQKHPEHLKVVELAKEIVIERAVVDYV